MKLSTIKALIFWIEVLTSTILYQSNIFPEQHRVDLHTAMAELIKALKEEK